jgi:hypothetical protein
VKTNRWLVGIIVILVIAIIGIVAWKSSSPSSNTTSIPTPTTIPSLSNTPPTNQIIEAAVYKYMTSLTSVYGLTPTYEWLEKVEVIRIGIPYTVNFPYTRKIWPIDAYLLGNQHREEVEGIICQDEFGDWQVSMSP